MRSQLRQLQSGGRHAKAVWIAAILIASSVTLRLDGQIAVRNQGFVPFADAPINYRGEVHDPVAVLQGKLSRGEATLTYDPTHGYLKSLLAALEIPINSQTLVFSKTSFQYKHISPQTPRALYFNDDVYVGKVKDGKALELVSFDARQGAIFYLLEEEPVERPVLQRAELDCTQCHVAASTRGVPGVMLRSLFTSPSGTQAVPSASFVTGHQSPLKDRFGGWYVTGTSGSQRHMGNVVVQNRAQPESLDREAGANLLDLSDRFDTSAYLTGSSDIVAHLVLAHQTQMHNLITLTNYQTRIVAYESEQRRSAEGQPSAALSADARNRFEGPAEELVRYLLFANEAPLEAPVAGDSDFAAEFSSRGPRDSRGRSLRDFDLKTRIFTYPCSYLIYSEAFDELPALARQYVYRRLLEVLTGADRSPEFERIGAASRQAILEILLDTKRGLPEEWQAYAK